MDVLAAVAVSRAEVARARAAQEVTPFCALHLERVADGAVADKADVKALMQQLAYLELALQFYHLRGGRAGTPAPATGQALADEFGLPNAAAVCQRMLEHFTEPSPGGLTRTKKGQDRCVLRCLAVALIIERCTIGAARLDELAQGFKQPVAWLYEYYAQLGCRLLEDSQHKLAPAGDKTGRGKPKKVVLEMPLRFPEIKKRGQRRG
jgi:hypothetical protein